MREELDKIPVTDGLINELYFEGKISKEAEDYAMNQLRSSREWGVWISRLLLIVGTVLMLSGIVYFCAFNWKKVTPLVRLSSIEMGMIACIVGACFYSLGTLVGRVLLFSASVLVGVFMAVYGQIYQTGADAYTLFMMWSLLIFGWTFVSNAAIQWLLWLIVTNVFIISWYLQVYNISQKEFTILMIIFLTFNGIILILREYFLLYRQYEWLSARWIRILIVVPIIFVSSQAMITFMLRLLDLPEAHVTYDILYRAVIGVMVHCVVYYFYRYKLLDIKAVSIVLLSLAMIVETTAIKVILEHAPHLSMLTYVLYIVVTYFVLVSSLKIFKIVEKNMRLRSE